MIPRMIQEFEGSCFRSDSYLRATLKKKGSRNESYLRTRLWTGMIQLSRNDSRKDSCLRKDNSTRMIPGMIRLNRKDSRNDSCLRKHNLLTQQEWFQEWFSSKQLGRKGSRNVDVSGSTTQQEWFQNDSAEQEWFQKWPASREAPLNKDDSRNGSCLRKHLWTRKIHIKNRQHTKFADIKLPFLFHELFSYGSLWKLQHIIIKNWKTTDSRFLQKL